MSAPWLFIQEDPRRNLALLRGEGAAETVQQIGSIHETVAGHRPTWSRAGGGWVIRRDLVADAMAYAQFHRRLVVLHERKEAAS
jgi:hypothetical protein